MADSQNNPLLSTARASDSSPNVQLHPLVLLTISDYITRHSLREQQTPIIGAIIGQQDGRTIIMEVAFECRLVQKDGDWTVDDKWFATRLEQYRDVFKVPQLDLVGWFSLGPRVGPQPHHVPIHTFFQVFNESALFLLFRPESVADSALSSGKLPLSIYETLPDSSSATDNAMDVDGAAAHPGRQSKFIELPYTVETSEAEMISVDFVARGGGNATAIDSNKTEAERKLAVKEAEGNASIKDLLPDKGKGKAKDTETQTDDVATGAPVLSAEDDELLSSITAKSNAIRMLHKRISLLQTYLSKLPQSHLTDVDLPITATDSPQQNQDTHTVLRSTSALLARLPILAPADTAAFTKEAAEVKADVALIDLLSSVTKSVQVSKEMGRKFSAVDDQRRSRSKGLGHMGGNQFFRDAMNDNVSGASDLFGVPSGKRMPFSVGDGGYV